MDVRAARNFICQLGLLGIFGVLLPSLGRAQEAWQVGVAKTEITPQGAVRLSGYGSRTKPTDVCRTGLFARCVAVASGGTGSGTNSESPDIHLLVSVDTIGLPAELSKEICDAIEDQHQIGRSKVVLSSTHTHCAPDLVSELSNIFSESLSDAEREAGLRYRAQLKNGVLDCVGKAIRSMAPATLSYARGEVDFAVNRRVLNNNRWSGFGVQSDGVVDHSVPLIAIRGSDGKVRGMIFNYACHCTSINPDVNEVNYDWAGYACAELEEQYSDAVAVCTIGCGADQNPNPRGETEMAMAHGEKLAKEINRLLDSEMRALQGEIEAKFDYAALSFDLPTIEEVRADLTNNTPQVRRRAEYLNEVYKRDGRLPATYPVPIQAWKLGDDLTMVFLGGEVVVDYGLRLRRELDDDELWVTAYANGVMGYLCSERMRIEGGYEYDYSAVYYNLPGPWAGGTEDFFVDRVKTLVLSKGRPGPLDVGAATDSFVVAEGYKVELVASEPLVFDPINLAFGADGRLWVVEMGDYPAGLEDGAKAGRVKYLTDSDGDGRYDSATTFMEGLEFPTGVFPWGNGVIVSAAPEIFYAEDTDGDGVADKRETLYSGFALANPQHRINGFTYGLDHSLHCASGDNLGELRSHLTSETRNASGRDVKIFPDSGQLELVSGRSQFIRSRNAWGEWFGNDNSRPLFQYVIDVGYGKREGAGELRFSAEQLFRPAVAPPVIPSSETVERFNDLYAANRFTSACSPIIVGGADSIGGRDVALICEPVHNLVHRAVLEPEGASYKAVRGATDAENEFLASRDPWFRPVRVLQGPDGGLWVADMYRESIEHPEWIPDAWKEQLDLRAGEDRGRIYRIIGPTTLGKQVVSLTGMSQLELVALLQDDCAALRDLAHQRLLELTRGKPGKEIIEKVEAMVLESNIPEARVHGLHVLNVWELLDVAHLIAVLRSEQAGYQLAAIELSERFLAAGDQQLLEAVLALADSNDERVVMRVALALGASEKRQAGEGLARIASRASLDRWTATAVEASMHLHAESIAMKLLASLRQDADGFGAMRSRLLERALVMMGRRGLDVGNVVEEALRDAEERAWGIRFASIAAGAIQLQGNAGQGSGAEVKSALGKLYDRSLKMMGDESLPVPQRCEAMSLLGIGLGTIDDENQRLLELLAVDVPYEVQVGAIEKLASLRQPQLAGVFIDRWDGLSTGIRDLCVSKMMTMGPWQEELVGALEAGRITVNDLSLSDRQQLRLTGSRSLQVRVDRILGSGGSLAKRQLVENYLVGMRGEVDRASGAELFAKHCAACHVATDGEAAVGASLSNLTNISSRFLVESILDPNRAVEPKYQSYTVLTADGRTLAGVLEDESTGAILLGQADGKRVAVSRNEIVQLKNSGLSLMPEGFEQQLSVEQMRDLVGFIANGGLASRANEVLNEND